LGIHASRFDGKTIRAKLDFGGFGGLQAA
jgi:hypothetical protein